MRFDKQTLSKVLQKGKDVQEKNVCEEKNKLTNTAAATTSSHINFCTDP